MVERDVAPLQGAPIASLPRATAGAHDLLRRLSAPWRLGRTRSSSYAPAYALTAAASLAFLSLVVTAPFRSLVSPLNIDDAFYYDQIARNFARGLFSTFDGVDRTNGYHPLWAAILTPVFLLVHDPALAVRTAKALELLMLAGAALLLMAAGRRAGWSPLVALIAPVCLFGCPVLYCGMETSVQVLLYAGLLALLIASFAPGAGRAPQVGVAVIACLLPWARLEALSSGVFALGALTLHAALGRHALRTVAPSWLGLALSVGAYFAYNQVVFGTAVPVSGAVKGYWSALRGDPLLHNAEAYAGAYRLQIVETLLVAAVAAPSWTFRAYRSATLSANHALDACVILLALSFLSRLAYASLFVSQAYDNTYYYVPYFVLHAVAVPYSLSRALLLASLATPGSGRFSRLPLVICALALAGTAWRVHPWTLPAQWRRPPAAASWPQASFDGAAWMSRNLPSYAVVGSPDSGVVGFFTDRRVINLDGLVNSREFFTAIRTQSVERWMRRAGITHLANAVRTREGDEGCAFIAAASAQRRPFRTPCTVVHRGLTFRQPWLGRSDEMQFRVFAFGSAPPAAR